MLRNLVEEVDAAGDATGFGFDLGRSNELG